jgi:glycerol-3-phosphate dehydrogenase
MEIQAERKADVVIIGGGITGAAIARELSRYTVETVLVERAGELAAGQSKVTLGNIYTGLNMVGSMVLKSILLAPGTPLKELYKPATLLERWSEQGFKDWPPVLDELGVRYNYEPLLIIAITEDQVEDLRKYVTLGRAIGGIFADFREVSRQEILDLEPNVNKDIVRGLYAADHIIDVFPPEVVLALAENASRNGVKILLDAEVTSVAQEGDYQVVGTTRGRIRTHFIVNAAGGWADRIADMGGGRDWGLQFRKTLLMILDRRLKGVLRGMVRLPNKPGLLQVVQRRDDNLLIECGTYDATDRPDDTGTIREDVDKAMAMAKIIVPSLSERDIISTFTGVRVFNTRDVEDHIVEFSPANPRFLNVVIRLPGVIGALPMSRHVVRMLADAGLELNKKVTFNPSRSAIPRVRQLSQDQRNALIAHDPRYGHVMCRCETVTEGEIVEAIKRGATTLDGVKFRTRAMMGTCQGNFCGPGIALVLSRALGQPLDRITKKGSESGYVSRKARGRREIEEPLGGAGQTAAHKS